MLTWPEIRRRLPASQRNLARRWHVSEGSLSRFLNGELKSIRLKRHLARNIGVQMSEIPDPDHCPTCHRSLHEEKTKAPVTPA